MKVGVIFLYNFYDSDIYFFTNEVTFLLNNKDKDKMIELVKNKHKKENHNNITTNNKRDDLLMWNVIFAREIIKTGNSKKYLHTIYNKYYSAIQNNISLQTLQKLELDMVISYFDILINHMDLKNNMIINKIMGYLYIHIENKVCLTTMSEDLNLSVGYLEHIFKKNIGMSIIKYSKILKVERAKILLSTSDKSILEISTILHFPNQANFTKIFKSVTSLTPKQYRNNS